MSLSSAARFGALTFALFCSALPVRALSNPEETAIDPADWGVYSQLAGQAFSGKVGSDTWRVTIEWKTPGQELVERWANTSNPLITQKIRTITRSGPGTLKFVANIGCIDRDGRVQADGSVLFICNSPRIKDPYQIVIGEGGALEQRDVKLAKDGSIGAVEETVRLDRELNIDEKRQYAAANAAPIDKAVWGAYADLAGQSFVGNQGVSVWQISVDWVVPGRELVERWESRSGHRDIVNTLTPEPGGGLRLASTNALCDDRIGAVQPDGSVLFVCKSGLMKWPVQMAAPSPGTMEQRSVSLSGNTISGVKETLQFAAIPSAAATVAKVSTQTPEDFFKQGLRFDNGDGVPANKAIAAEWYRKAADNGYAPAQHKLGNLYRDGSGVAQDHAQAISWFRKAADQGDMNGQNDLGAMYLRGDGVAKDAAQAAAWFRKAADQGLGTAQMNLAALYENGQGVAQSEADAIAWYEKAAAQGQTEGQSKVNALRERKLAAQQLAARRVEAERATASALASNDSEVQFQLARRLQKGDGKADGYPEDKVAAATLYRKAAEQGHAAAQNMLGLSLVKGWGVTPDIPQAIGWYRKAALAGNVDAQTNLGWMYESGQGVPQDDAQAEAWYRKAAATGDDTARMYLNDLLAKRESEEEYDDRPPPPSGAQIFANAMGTFSQEYNKAMTQQAQAQAQIQQAYARAEAERRREEMWELRRREAEQRIAREEAEATQARAAEYAQLQETRKAEAAQAKADAQHANDAQAKAEAGKRAEAKRVADAREKAEAAQKLQEQRAAEALLAKQEAERKRQAEEAARQAERERIAEQKRLEEEARNRPVAYREGIVLCEPKPKPSTAWSCYGPMTNLPAMLDTPSGNAAIGAACGADTYRDLGMVSGYRAYGCGFGIHPTDRAYPGNLDIPAKFGVNVPNRGTYFCNPRKVDAMCRGRG